MQLSWILIPSSISLNPTTPVSRHDSPHRRNIDHPLGLRTGPDTRYGIESRSNAFRDQVRPLVHLARSELEGLADCNLLCFRYGLYRRYVSRHKSGTRLTPAQMHTENNSTKHNIHVPRFPIIILGRPRPRGGDVHPRTRRCERPRLTHIPRPATAAPRINTDGRTAYCLPFPFVRVSNRNRSRKNPHRWVGGYPD